MLRFAVLFLFLAMACSSGEPVPDDSLPDDVFDAGSEVDAGLPTCTAPQDVDGGTACQSDEECTADEYCFFEVTACAMPAYHVERNAPGRCITPCCGTRNCEGARCATSSDCGPQEACGLTTPNVCEWGGECTAVIECPNEACPLQLVPGTNCPSCVCETCP